MARIDGLKDEFGRFMQRFQMERYLTDAGFMHASKLLPKSGAFGLHGVLIKVAPPPPAEYYARDGRKIKSSKHRVFATCDCGRDVPFGRLGQHRKACRANVFAGEGGSNV